MYQTLIDRGVRHLYHFTDKSNIESIINCGGLLSLVALKEKGLNNVKHGGNQLSHYADSLKGVDRYVHLCFRDTHPMKYVASNEGRISNPCWLEINLSILGVEGVLYSSDVSNKSGVRLLPPDEAKKEIDLEGLYDFLDFHEEGNQARKNNARKSEILIPNIVPIDKILNIELFRG